MNTADASRLIAFASNLDSRAFPIDPEKARLKAVAWGATILDDVPLDFAREVLVDHYRCGDGEFTPSKINARWDAAVRAREAATVNLTAAHCGRSGCHCTHTGGCFKGWIDRADGPVAPCGRCRPWTAERVKVAPRPGHRNDGDQYRMRGEGVDRRDVDNDTPTPTMAWGQTDNTPVETDPVKIAARLALLRELAATPGLTEEQREQRMIDLIAAQKSRG